MSGGVGCRFQTPVLSSRPVFAEIPLTPPASSKAPERRLEIQKESTIFALLVKANEMHGQNPSAAGL